MQQLDLYKLQIFARVAAAGSLSSAAAELEMTQSAISQHVRALEDQIGAVLFERGNRGVTLTAAGQVLQRHSELILRQVAQATAEVSQVADTNRRRITIGATPGVSAYLLPEWVEAFGQQHPDAAIGIETAVTAQIVAALRQSRSELAVVEGELDPAALHEFNHCQLAKFEQYVVVGPRHPWWQREQIQIGDLQDAPVVTRQAAAQTRLWLDQLLREAGVTVRIIAELDNLESIKRLVSRGQALAILPAYTIDAEVAGGQLRALTVDDTILQRALTLLWPHGAVRPAVRRFISFLRNRKAL
jgi:DNA-binding transcriptional LysR family regulator